MARDAENTQIIYNLNEGFWRPQEKDWSETAPLRIPEEIFQRNDSPANNRPPPLFTDGYTDTAVPLAVTWSYCSWEMIVQLLWEMELRYKDWMLIIFLKSDHQSKILPLVCLHYEILRSRFDTGVRWENCMVIICAGIFMSGR